jgi:hypothetical protein
MLFALYPVFFCFANASGMTTTTVLAYSNLPAAT